MPCNTPGRPRCRDAECLPLSIPSPAASTPIKRVFSFENENGNGNENENENENENVNVNENENELKNEKENEFMQLCHADHEVLKIHFLSLFVWGTYRMFVLTMSCYCAMLHRRHLMVWAIFAPKVSTYVPLFFSNTFKL